MKRYWIYKGKQFKGGSTLSADTVIRLRVNGYTVTSVS